jgi:pimeloyl-ACP methyl ester carboxylesterase
MPHIDLDGQSVYFSLKKSDPARPMVVLLHGAGGSHLGWPPGLRRLPDFAVMGVDLPGHGRSPQPGRQKISDYADDIAKLLAQQKTGPAIFIGHSMGGAIAQTMALSYPERVAGLVLIGTGAKLPVSSHILDKALTEFTAVANFITRYSWAADAPPAIVEKAHQELLKTAPAVLHGDFVACNNFNVMTELGQIAVPTLVIAGSSDKMTPPRFGRYLADQIPNAQFHLIENAGHMMMLERMGEVTAVTTQFLANHFK